MKFHFIEATTLPRFKALVDTFMEEHYDGEHLGEVKFQRNLYYSLSGSTHKPEERVKETATLKEGYIAFILCACSRCQRRKSS
jgi:hypothetical protein